MPLTLVPPRRSRNWRIRGTVRGVYIDETTGVASRELAEAIRIKREGQLLDESVFGVRASRTFAEAAIAYVETKRPRGTQRAAIIGRVRKKDGSVSPCLVTDFGSRLVSTIDQAAVDEITARRFAHAKPSTMQRQLIAPLVAVLRYAAKRKWCDVPAFERPRFDDRRRRWAAYEEADRLLAALAPHLRPLVLFLLLTGARTGEAIKLVWDDVDLSGRWVVFRDTKRGSGAQALGEDRGVPLHPQLVAVLANLPLPTDGRRKGRVFLTSRGRPYTLKPEGGGYFKSAWDTALARAGIRDLRPHDLRHTCSTWLTMAGVHEQVRDEIIGHASTSMGRRYSHVPRPDLAEAINRLPERGAGISMQQPRPVRIKPENRRNVGPKRRHNIA